MSESEFECDSDEDDFMNDDDDDYDDDFSDGDDLPQPKRRRDEDDDDDDGGVGLEEVVAGEYFTLQTLCSSGSYTTNLHSSFFYRYSDFFDQRSVSLAPYGCQ